MIRVRGGILQRSGTTTTVVSAARKANGKQLSGKGSSAQELKGRRWHGFTRKRLRAKDEGGRNSWRWTSLDMDKVMTAIVEIRRDSVARGGEAVEAARGIFSNQVVGIAAIFGAVLAVSIERLWWELLARLQADIADIAPYASGSGPGSGLVLYEGEKTESIEWLNTFLRKIWRVYQANLERWFCRVLSPVVNNGATGKRPNLIKSLTVEKFTLDHEPPLLRNIARRNSRKDSDLNCVVDVRYTGGARMLLMLETGVVKIKIPVEVSDFDVEGRMWFKVRLAPLVPYVGTISAAFIGEPNIQVQLAPYSRIPLMRMPVIQDFLQKLLTKDLPGLMVLPKKLEINIPPALTAVAAAAIGEEEVTRAVAAAVVNADLAPYWVSSGFGPQRQAAGGMSLPETFIGELTVLVREARNLRVGGLRGISDPYCFLKLGAQSVESRRSRSTGDMKQRRGHPVWNQEFQMLIQDPKQQLLNFSIRDTRMTLKPELGSQMIQLSDLEDGKPLIRWIRLNTEDDPRQWGSRFFDKRKNRDPAVLLELTYKSFDEDDDPLTPYTEATEDKVLDPAFTSEDGITDVRSAVAATRRAAANSARVAAQAAAATAKTAKETAIKAATAALGKKDSQTPTKYLPAPPRKSPMDEGAVHTPSSVSEIADLVEVEEEDITEIHMHKDDDIENAERDS